MRLYFWTDALHIPQHSLPSIDNRELNSLALRVVIHLRTGKSCSVCMRSHVVVKFADHLGQLTHNARSKSAQLIKEQIVDDFVATVDFLMSREPRQPSISRSLPS